MRGLFVTGTDTGVGKTIVSAAIVAVLRERGITVKVLKPVLTGLDQPADPCWPADHELLAAVAGCEPDDVAVIRYGPAVSPHLAAELARRPVDPDELRRAVEVAARASEVLIVEGVGGLLVPFGPDYDVRCFARSLGMPLLIAARPGLGTINHTLLTVEAARAASLRVAGVVFTPWPEVPGEIERSNRHTVQRAAAVTVSTLAAVARPAPELLAQAGRALPLDRWLSGEASIT